MKTSKEFKQKVLDYLKKLSFNTKVFLKDEVDPKSLDKFEYVLQSLLEREIDQKHGFRISYDKGDKSIFKFVSDGRYDIKKVEAVDISEKELEKYAHYYALDAGSMHSCTASNFWHIKSGNTDHLIKIPPRCKGLSFKEIKRLHNRVRALEIK